MMLLTRSLLSTVIFCVLLFCLASCAAIKVSEESVPDVVQEYQKSVVSGKELSLISTQYLRVHGLNPEETKNPDEIFQAVKKTEDEEKLTKIHTMAEFALGQAIELEVKNTERAIDWHLLAADKAYQGLFLTREGRKYGAFDYRYQQLSLFYKRALIGLVESLKKSKETGLTKHKRTFLDQTYSIDLAEGEHLWDPNYFDELHVAAKLGFEGITNRHGRFGLGISLMGYYQNRQEKEIDQFYPRVGVTRPLSVFLTFSDNKKRNEKTATLAFYDSRDVETITVEGMTAPLAADFSAPFAYLVSKTSLKSINLEGTIGADEAVEKSGIAMVDPYDPMRIPLITVHGLLSSPATWIDVHNELMGDPLIRKKYQIWHFNYPPGAPIFYSAKLFREKLDQLMQFLEPQSPKSKLKSAVVLSHSMGGLLSRTVVGNSGDEMWNTIFSEPPEKMAEFLTPEEIEEIRKTLYFDRKPFIKRVIFVAVPHRGSPVADNPLSKLGRNLISIPLAPLRLVSSIKDKIADKLRPEVKENIDQPSTSIDGLSPTSPGIRALSKIAISKKVPFHSIIGDQGKGDGEAGSDGVVPYTSAHLEGAESELIVPADHSAHHHPLAVLEIKRILKLHLGS